MIGGASHGRTKRVPDTGNEVLRCLAAKRKASSRGEPLLTTFGPPGALAGERPWLCRRIACAGRLRGFGLRRSRFASREPLRAFAMKKAMKAQQAAASQLGCLYHVNKPSRRIADVTGPAESRVHFLAAATRCTALQDCLFHRLQVSVMATDARRC